VKPRMGLHAFGGKIGDPSRVDRERPCVDTSHTLLFRTNDGFNGTHLNARSAVGALFGVYLKTFLSLADCLNRTFCLTGST
jgi:hypothetical protein